MPHPLLGWIGLDWGGFSVTVTPLQGSGLYFGRVTQGSASHNPGLEDGIPLGFRNATPFIRLDWDFGSGVSGLGSGGGHSFRFQRANDKIPPPAGHRVDERRAFSGGSGGMF